MENEFFTGSICLSDIPKELIKKAGNGKMYLNISVGSRKEADQYGRTHYISCSPKKEDRVEGKNYFIGDLKKYQQESSKAPTPEDIQSAPAATSEDVELLPF